MRFQTAKNLLKIDKVNGMGRPNGRLDAFGGTVGGRGGGQQRLLESDRNWQESAVSVPNALLPARGAADLKANASCRRPQNTKRMQRIKDDNMFYSAKCQHNEFSCK